MEIVLPVPEDAHPTALQVAAGDYVHLEHGEAVVLLEQHSHCVFCRQAVAGDLGGIGEKLGCLPQVVGSSQGHLALIGREVRVAHAGRGVKPPRPLRFEHECLCVIGLDGVERGVRDEKLHAGDAFAVQAVKPDYALVEGVARRHPPLILNPPLLDQLAAFASLYLLEHQVIVVIVYPQLLGEFFPGLHVGSGKLVGSGELRGFGVGCYCSDHYE